MTWKFDDIGFRRDVEAILAEQRAKGQLAHNRARFWDQALQSLEDHDDPLGDRPANRR